MFCLDFRRQHIFTPDKIGLFPYIRKNNDSVSFFFFFFMKQIGIYFHTKRGDWFALCTSTNLTAVLTNNYEITIQS